MSEQTNLRFAIERLRTWVPGDNLIKSDMSDLVAVLNAAESTLPKTKEVEVWHVEWADGNIPHIDDPYLTREDAEHGAMRRRCEDRGTCIRVTGPHKQEVPA